MTDLPRVTVWNEYLHERTKPEVARIYPRGMHETIAEYLRSEGFAVQTATLDQPEQGLTGDVLSGTDVLLWWGHDAHDQVGDEIVTRVHQRVLGGMGLIALHSSHHSSWRCSDHNPSTLWDVAPGLVHGGESLCIRDWLEVTLRASCLLDPALSLGENGCRARVYGRRVRLLTMKYLAGLLILFPNVEYQYR